MILPRAMSHVAITVPDIDAAFAWYRDVLGCYVIANPSKAHDDDSNLGNVVKDIFGEEFGGLKLAHLSTADGVGIELFQFIKPKTYVPDNTFDYACTGIFHICIIAADIETTATQIEANGGKLASKIWRLFSNKDYKVCYCWDPWDTVIELNSHSYLQTWSNLEEPHKL
jgi:catechol 2,3-dioxygenase-like lactoylglutathione lyase family enzyme